MAESCKLTLEVTKVITNEGPVRLHNLISNILSAESLRQVLGLFTNLALNSQNQKAMLSGSANTVKLNTKMNIPDTGCSSYHGGQASDLPRSCSSGRAGTGDRY